MRIQIHDPNRRDRHRAFSAEIDLRHPATVVHRPHVNPNAPHESGREEIYLDWDQTLDDHGHLRRCPVCGCRDLYTRKDFPQITGFVILLLAAVVAIVLFGFAQQWLALGIFILVLLLDLGIYFFANRCLVCYQCKSEYRDVDIGPHHAKWEMATAERYRPD